MKKIAVVLFNLGGPDGPEAVQPFLFNLFNDPAIIRVSNPLRYFIAKIISSKRAPIAKQIYAKIGGASPILENTHQQARALETELNKIGPTVSYKTFIIMRYWHPFANEIAPQVKAYGPDQLLLLPLYPQFSTTTTGSSFHDWYRAARCFDISIPTSEICCYPDQEGFIAALAEKVHMAYAQIASQKQPRILFSAHGLPEKIIAGGDPYAEQCMTTVAALRSELAITDLDSVLCYQSRVGPLRWIGPSTDDEIRRAGEDKVPVIVVPIAFVSDHSETLVEIDIEYRHLAAQCGVPEFVFVSAVGTASLFINGLTRMVHERVTQTNKCASANGARICPAGYSGCPCSQKKEG